MSTFAHSPSVDGWQVRRRVLEIGTCYTGKIRTFTTLYGSNEIDESGPLMATLNLTEFTLESTEEVGCAFVALNIFFRRQLFLFHSDYNSTPIYICIEWEI